MATAAKKKPAAKTNTKAVSKSKPKAAKSKIKEGDRYQCGVCGMAVTVDEVCGCMETHDIVCCGKQMKPKKK